MTARVIAALLVVLACVGGCGRSKDTQASSSAPQQPAPPGLVVDISINGGNVTPTNGEFKAKTLEPIQLRVKSDVPDELHVHSVPDHTFVVAAKPGQVFEFTVDVPGRVEVEVHKLGRMVATIHVQQ